MSNEALTAVTAEQWAVILPDLEKLLKTKQKAGEDLSAYALRLVKMASDEKKVSDDDWETLEDVTQMWVNGSKVADEKGEPPLLPPGVVGAPADAASGETEPAEATKAPAKTANGSKAPAKKAVAKKVPAKKAAAKKAAAKKTPAKSGEKSRGRPTLFSDADKITIKQKEPFRAGSASAIGFAKMKTGMTVEKAIEAGTPRRLIRWSKICDYIEVAAAK